MPDFDSMPLEELNKLAQNYGMSAFKRVKFAVENIKECWVAAQKKTDDEEEEEEEQQQQPFPQFSPETLRSLMRGSASDGGLTTFINHLKKCRTDSGLLEVKRTAEELVRQSQRLFADIESLAQPEGNCSEEERLTQLEPGFWIAYYLK
jgi:hypothetical protein